MRAEKDLKIFGDVDIKLAMLYGGRMQMFKTMKMSQYNLSTYDDEGNLVIYNFLTGLEPKRLYTNSIIKSRQKIVDKRLSRL